jgi:hypothetical protein
LATRKRLEGEFNNLGSYWAYGHIFHFFKSLPWLLALQNTEVLLNNFSKSYPNLTPIQETFLTKKIEKMEKKLVV